MCKISPQIDLDWNKEINQEKGKYGIQEAEHPTQNRDEGNSKENSEGKQVRICAADTELEDRGLGERRPQERKHKNQKQW